MIYKEEILNLMNSKQQGITFHRKLKHFRNHNIWEEVNEEAVHDLGPTP